MVTNLQEIHDLEPDTEIQLRTLNRSSQEISSASANDNFANETVFPNELTDEQSEEFDDTPVKLAGHTPRPAKRRKSAQTPVRTSSRKRKAPRKLVGDLCETNQTAPKVKARNIKPRYINSISRYCMHIKWRVFKHVIG